MASNPFEYPKDSIDRLRSGVKFRCIISLVHPSPKPDRDTSLMRMIGHIQGESNAKLFSDYLYVQGIENQVESDEEPRWALWIHSEDQIDTAKKLLAEFESNPSDPRYRQGAEAAERQRVLDDKAEQEARKRMIDGREAVVRAQIPSIAPLTLLFIVISVLVSLISSFGDKTSTINNLFLSAHSPDPSSVVSRLLSMREVLQGQVWRVFTPIFIHFGFIHLVFNMLWLKDLGSVIEKRESTGTLAILVLSIAGLSNVAQFLLHGPSFGGMSGVVYGLLGYIWIRGKFDPFSGYFVPPSTLVFMGLWFFACVLGIISNVANTVHAVGLLSGMAWGYISAKQR